MLFVEASALSPEITNRGRVVKRSALVWFAIGAGVAGATSILSTYVLSKRAGTDLVVTVYGPINAKDRDWDSMSHDEIVDNELAAVRAVRECGVTKFKTSTVYHGPQFTEFALDLHATHELNCIFGKAYEERLPLHIEDMNEDRETGVVSATASVPDLDTAREDENESVGE